MTSLNFFINLRELVISVFEGGAVMKSELLIE